MFIGRLFGKVMRSKTDEKTKASLAAKSIHREKINDGGMRITELKATPLSA